MLAAVEMIWATVTTPVPPTPVIRMLKSSAGTRRTGSVSAPAPRAGPVFRRARRPVLTVMKDGQSPSRQE
jgi:hypothetical protein